MRRDHDAQLLESVRVRRLRLRDALIHGDVRSRRAVGDLGRRVLLGVLAAAMAAAACTGVSFVKEHIHDPTSLPSPGRTAPELSRT